MTSTSLCTRRARLGCAAFAALAGAFGAIAGTAHGQSLRSADVLEFGPAQTLFVGDNVSGAVHAFALADRPEGPAEPAPFNIDDLDAVLARALDIPAGQLMINDVAVHPRSGEAVLAVNAGPAADPFIVLLTAGGDATVLPLAQATVETLALRTLPDEDLIFWGETPARSFTVTDIEFYRGEVFVSGLSNGEFASVLRRAPYPFNGDQEAASIEIYHAVHNQTETRAPIETFEIVEFEGEPHILAAYLCTPIVTAPLSAFTDGAHVRGKTIAELGWGNTPIDLVGFEVDVPWMQGPHFLLTNQHRSAMLMSLDDIAAHQGMAGITEPVPFPIQDHAGVPYTGLAMGNVVHIADQGGPLLLSLIRHKETGRVELGSRVKGLFLRISEFIDEYDFPDYAYETADNAEWQQQNIRPARSWLMQVEGMEDFIK